DRVPAFAGGFGAAAFTPETVRLRLRFATATPDTTLRPPSSGVAAPRVARRAKRGGPGRTRTCNQTVMSGRLSIAFVDFTGFPVGFVCVRCVPVRPFLVRNWSGAEEGGLKRRTMLASL